MAVAEARVTTTSWDEETTHAVAGGARLTRVRLTNAYAGGVEGEGTADALLAYVDERSGEYVALQQLVGRVGARVGTFVLHSTGTFAADGTILATSVIVAGTGTGDLAGIAGRARYAAHTGEATATLTLEHDGD